MDWAALGAAAVNGEMPAGVPCSSEASYHTLERTVGSLGASQEDLEEALQSAASLLELRGKDFRVAIYATKALFKTEGIEGLADGLACIHAMAKNFWEAAHPKLQYRESWFGNLSDFVRSVLTNIDSQQTVAIERCADTASDLGEFLEHKLGKQLNFNTIAVDLRKLIPRKKDTAPPEPAPPKSAAESPKVLPLSAPPDELSKPITAIPLPPPAGAPTALQVRNALLKDAHTARKHNRAELWPYRAVRTAAWRQITKPLTYDSQLASIPPPSEYLIRSLAELTGSASWDDLCDKSEQAIPEHPLFLDLHIHSAKALSELGGAHQLAAEFVRSEAQLFLEEFPWVAELKFNDGTPFLSDSARAFLTVKAQSAEVPSTRSTISTRRKRFENLIERIRALVQANHPELALAALGALDSEITRFSLEEWDSEICVEVFELWLNVLDPLRGSDTRKSELFNSVFARLISIDPGRKIGLGEIQV
ncbi:MAG: type VI secretion system domain-containing protein [Acidobacteriaceae bacterium]|nr:type VI secretion system domain-containing protein [Acidobacteriaceae bacterium]MBV9296405.1 type VI secretion system domain-containing protein [Acidobacteriaceae bacterium]MBV9764383.1 type VI secretion system domain-containing protein [Acidobacteriaceae bacterium]